MGQVIQFRRRVSNPVTFDMAHAALQIYVAVLLLALELQRIQLTLLSEAMEG